MADSFKTERHSCSVSVNAQVLFQEIDLDDSLLAVLHQHQLTAAKLGCGQGQCGACTVLVDHQAMRACEISFSSLLQSKVVTLEGLGQTHPTIAQVLQEAFIEEQAAQCGYCSAGVLMKVASLLLENMRRTRQEFALALDANLCRCGSHQRILNAVMLAQERFLDTATHG